MPVRKVNKDPEAEQEAPAAEPAETIPWAGEIDAPIEQPEATHQVTDETDAVVAEATDAQFEALKAVESSVAPLGGFTVRALQSFGDIQSNRSYKPGDTVPWGITRARHYARRGLVEIVEDAVPE